MMSALWRQRPAGLCGFQATLVYIVSSRPARTTERDPVSNINKQINKLIIKYKP